MSSSIYVKSCSLQAPESLHEWKNEICIHHAVFFWFCFLLYFSGWPFLTYEGTFFKKN